MFAYGLNLKYAYILVYSLSNISLTPQYRANVAQNAPQNTPPKMSYFGPPERIFKVWEICPSIEPLAPMTSSKGRNGATGPDVAIGPNDAISPDVALGRNVTIVHCTQWIHWNR